MLKPRVTRIDIARQIAPIVGLTIPQTDFTLQKALEELAICLSLGQMFSANELGILETKVIPPSTKFIKGTYKAIPAHGRLTFRPSKPLREKIHTLTWLPGDEP